MITGRTAVPIVGHGSADAHHGEVLQGAFADAGGRLVTGVVSLPLPELASHASFRPRPGHLVVRPTWKVKALAAARATLDHLEHDGGGELLVGDRLPVGRGFGSSTADVVSAIRAVTSALRRPVSALCSAQLAVSAEGASDSVMFGDRTVLFASREGRVLQDLGGPLPGVEVLSFDDGTGLDTLALPPPRYSSEELARFEWLRERLSEATRVRSPRLLAEVASENARINHRHRPKAGFELATWIGAATSALGVQTAHTGSLLALLYDPVDPQLELRVAGASEALRQHGVTNLRRFRTMAPGGRR